MDKRTFSWILSAAKSAVFSIGIITVFALLLSFINLGFTVVSKSVLDTATGQAEGNLLALCAALAALLIIEISLQAAITLISTHADARIEIFMKNRVFSRLFDKSYSSVSGYHSGDLLNRITSDVAVISSAVITIVPNVVMLLGGLLLSAGYLFKLDPVLAVIIIIVGAGVGAASRLYSRRFKNLHKKCQQTEGRTRSFMQEMLQNIIVVKSFNAADTVTEKSAELQRDNYRWQIKRAKASIFAKICMFMVYNAGYYVVLGYGAWRLAAGAFTFGTVAALLQLVNKIQSPFKELSSMIPQFYQAAASAERLMELEDIPDEQAQTELPESVRDSFSDIAFRGVRFSYDGTSEISVPDFEAERGKITVLIGGSGGGKSTAVKLMMGLLTPESGGVYIRSGAQEYDTVSHGRGFFSYVPQGNLIFSGTIRENIAFGEEYIDDEKITAAAKAAQILDFINEQPDGFDTVLGERGLGLSEGQTQRISVARAILHDAPVLILDEATSALDPQTERDMLSAIKNLGKTVVFVSHREAAFDFCDRVVKIGDL